MNIFHSLRLTRVSDQRLRYPLPREQCSETPSLFLPSVSCRVIHARLRADVRSIRHTRTMALEFYQFGLQGSRFSHLSLQCRDWCGEWPEDFCSIEVRAWKFPPHVCGLEDFSKSCSTSDLAVVNQRRGVTRGKSGLKRAL